MSTLLQLLNVSLYGFIAAMLLIQYNEHQNMTLRAESFYQKPHELQSSSVLANDISAKVVDQLKVTSSLKESNIRLLRLEARTEQIERTLGLTNRWGVAQ